MKHLLTLSLCVPILLAAGCASSPPVKRVEAGSPNALTTAGIDIADFKSTAGKIVESMLAQDPSPFGRIQGRKARIKVNHVKNDTSQYFDVSQITFKITTDLMNSGRTETLTTYGDTAEDKAGQGTTEANRFLRDQKQITLPDFSLAGKILETVARQGNQREYSYTLQLFLTDMETGSAVWQGEQIVSKQAHKRAVGF